MKFERAQLDHDLCDSVVMRDMTRIRALLAQGANVNAKDVEHNETPLMLAVKFADAAMIGHLQSIDRPWPIGEFISPQSPVAILDY